MGQKFQDAACTRSNFYTRIKDLSKTEMLPIHVTNLVAFQDAAVEVTGLVIQVYFAKNVLLLQRSFRLPLSYNLTHRPIYSELRLYILCTFLQLQANYQLNPEGLY